MDKTSRILVLGHRGLVGGAIHLKLAQLGYAPRHAEGHIQALSEALGQIGDAEYVFLCAGVGGGIAKNLRAPAKLCRDTLQLLTSTFEAARRKGVRRLLWFACACVYPRLDRPATERDLWSGPLEPTSQAFAAAQLAGIELTRAYQQQFGMEFLALCLPTLYGHGDEFSEDSHVPAAMIRKLHEAKVAGDSEVVFWGSGRQRRQFMYVEDAAAAAAEIMQSPDFPAWIPLLNVAGHPSRRLDEVAESIADVVGYAGRIRWDPTKPEGAPRKEILGGWTLSSLPTLLRVGVQRTYEWYLTLPTDDT